MRTPPSKEGGQALLAGMFGMARHDKEPTRGGRAPGHPLHSPMATIRKRTWKSAKGAGTAFSVDYFDAQGKRQRKQFATRAEANDFRVEIEGQMRSGTYRPEATRMLVRELADLFLAHCKARMERGERMTRRNYETYEGYVRNYICPDREWHSQKHAAPHHQFQFFDKGLGNLKLSRLTVGTVTKLRDDLRDTGLSVATTRKILAMLQVMLAYGISLDLIAFNAATNVEVIGRRDEEIKRIVPPSKDMMRALIELADERFRVKLIFAAATGVRASELHALRWRHIDFDRREVRIETRVDPYGVVDVPKTKAGLRTIPLGESVLSALSGWRRITRFPASDDLVFPNRLGSYFNHTDMVKRKFLPLFAKLAAIWERERRNEPVEVFTWHALRHFAISCWIEAGLPPKAVQTFAGHSSLQVTMDRYGHLFRSDSHSQAMDAISHSLVTLAQPPKWQSRKKPTTHSLS
jgi:integrase